MVYTAIFQNKSGHYTAIRAFGGPDRTSAWNNIQSKEAPTDEDMLLFLIPGSHVVLEKHDVTPTRTIDPFELNY